MQPKMLLFDEPSQGLDATRQRELHRLLHEVSQSFPIPMLLVTHDLEEAIALGDQMLLLTDGRIVQRGTPAEVLDQPKDETCAQLLGLFSILPGEIVHLDPSQNISRLKLLDGLVQTKYLPGHLKGDTVKVALRPAQVRAMPKGKTLALGQLSVTLHAVVERSETMRLEFAEGIAAEIDKDLFAELGETKDWMVEIAPAAMRVL